MKTIRVVAAVIIKEKIIKNRYLRLREVTVSLKVVGNSLGEK